MYNYIDNEKGVMYKMKFSRKILQLFFISVLGIITFFSPTISKAESNPINPSVLTVEQQDFVKKQVYLKVDKTGKTQSISKNEFEEAKKLHKPSPESIEVHNKNAIQQGNSISLQKENTNDNVQPSITKSATQNVLGILYLTTYNEYTNTVDLSITITDIIGQVPIIVLGDLSLYAGKVYDGKYYRKDELEVDWTGGEIYAGHTATKSYKVTSTNWWVSANTTTVGWVGSPPQTDKGQLDPTLVNKKAVMYPLIYNADSKQYLPPPARADLPRGQKHKRDSTYRKRYIDNYEKTYGKPPWDWNDMQVHHIIPLAWGGNNELYNLYGLPTEIHKKVTNWWRSY